MGGRKCAAAGQRSSFTDSMKRTSRRHGQFFRHGQVFAASLKWKAGGLWTAKRV